MFATGNNIIAIIEEFAAPAWTLPGDTCGLQWGDPNCSVKSVLLALDFNEAVLEEALTVGANFVFTHHPFFYNPLLKLDLRERRTALLARALKEGVVLYSAHTNLDVAPYGVSHALGKLLGLEHMTVLHPTDQEKLEKLVVFIPEGFEDKVRNALTAAGAGWIGNYSHCTFQLMGTGTFLPREGSSPFIGTPGVVEKVREYRLETILPVAKRDNVLEAMRYAHPYEEVAYDLYPLSLEGEKRGLGRVGELPEPDTLQALASRCREMLRPCSIKMLGEAGRKVQRVAVLGGSGAAYLPAAVQSGAQVFISGDLRYHDAQQACDAGLALLDAGHAATERPVIPVVAAFLREKLKQNGYETDVIIGREEEIPWVTLD
ncbi:MAG: Nif3-like dinuclear metal center hexameric protein [Bacillota bacterium]